MYKINHKAVLLIFVLQLLVGAIWYTAAPVSLARDGVDAATASTGLKLLFAFSTLVYLYFTAWLLVKVKWASSFGMMLLVVGIWLFVVLPNFAFVSIHLSLSSSDFVYLMLYGAMNCAIAAIILPLWRTSRSIFKG
ncbi:hypothetical protein [Marinomonas epiphytica]